MFDTRTKITALIGIVVSAARILIPNLVPDGVEEHLNNVLAAILFLVAFYMRSGIQKVEKAAVKK